MTRKREKLQAYFAGLFDGEGTVGLYEMGAGQWSLRVAISMTDPRPVGLLYREYPEGKFYSKSYKNRPETRPYYVFGLHGTHTERFLREIEPYVILKQDQIKLGRSFLAHQSRFYAAKRRDGFSRYVRYPEEYYTRTKSIAEKMKKAKLGITAVNSVKLLLKHELRQYRAEQEDVNNDVTFLLQALEGVETRHRETVEAISSAEKDIVLSVN